MILQIFFNLGNQLSIVGPVLIKPEYGRCSSGPGPVNRKFNPVFHCDIFGLAHAKNVATVNVLLKQRIARAVYHTNATFALGLKCFIM